MRFCSLLLALASGAVCADENGIFPFVIKANGTDSAVDMRFLLPAPAGRDGFVRTEGERFAPWRPHPRYTNVNELV